MSQLQEFKCPNCAGPVTFQSDLQKMKCPYCDAEFNVSAVKAWKMEQQESQSEQLDWKNDTNAWKEAEMQSIRVYACESCGGEILAGENSTATSCPFCDNAVVVKALVSGALRPDLVIPFKLDKEAAKAALRKHYSKYPLLPRTFRKENHIDELQGIYVPFWLFDAKTNTKVTYLATRRVQWTDYYYAYTQTSHYQLVKSGTMTFHNVPVDGSAKLDDRLTESIEPYDMKEAVPFNGAYLAGYLAEKYDVNMERSKLRANARIKSSAMEAFQPELHQYDTAEQESAVVQMKESRVKYVLCPLWLLNTTWRGKRYTFAMNGQTGKLVGDLPAVKGAMAAMFFAVCGIVSALCFGLCSLLWLM